ncbi:MAG: hypothetical protein V4760_04750 [Bdellovibrionota bacterium]
MKTARLALTFGMLLVSSSSLADTVDWRQPPVAKVEDIVPQMPDRPCPDLTAVVDITKDPLEPSVAPDDLPYWKARKYRLPLCRSLEIQRRETETPGTFTAGTLALVTMRLQATRNHQTKIAAVNSASRIYGVPPLVLTGALYQESLFAELGVSDDGDNYSCGVAQINLYEWCKWANGVDAAKKAEIGWPTTVNSCQTDDRLWIKPFFAIAKAKKGFGTAVEAEFFEGIGYDQVVTSLPPADRATQELRVRRAHSFLKNCTNPTNAIAAKANELADLYRVFIPNGLKRAQRIDGKPHPLHVGWLLAVGAYNAGPRVVEAMIHSRGFTPAQLEDSATFENFTPMDLVRSLFWAGKWNPVTDNMKIETRSGVTTEMKWIKLCIVQRHVSRIVEHVTLATAAPLVHSMETEYGACSGGERDPVTKKLVKTGVPEIRQTSDGHLPVEK